VPIGMAFPFRRSGGTETFSEGRKKKTVGPGKEPGAMELGWGRGENIGWDSVRGPAKTAGTGRNARPREVEWEESSWGRGGRRSPK